MNAGARLDQAMADLVFSHVRKCFPGGVVAVEDFTLTVPNPTMVVLVGPSGCGKTTVLRMVAGLEQPDAGEIHLGAARLDTLPPRQRDIAMVFQSYALYPHMTVAENLSFGLRLRRVARERIAERVGEVARTLEIDELLARKPGELSGGQRQRVALGRAIIREPRVFLFDEPLSNLDARLRAEMRASIKRLYRRLRVTSIYVTHDQVEAMTIGEMLVVMNRGRIHQVGTPETCYRLPADTFVASFLGAPAMNLIEARWDAAAGVMRHAGGAIEAPPAVRARLGGYRRERVVIGVRPEDVGARPETEEPTLRLEGRVALLELLGGEMLTHVDVGGAALVARGKNLGAGEGEAATVYVPESRVHVFSAEDGRRMDAAAG
ncbi:MAG: sn-glycerol-3-phosphate ABC transporter ATP-binding protein UgpC [Candidatus Krumholzibacteria bacterium]|nr:sn-glycerol-3-phosphate ABC transporter ATP-binding protein UgpC [Candidatus Krumholzibacteria bacterium]